MRTNYQNSNIRENTYYIKFQSCKKCWTKGAILGIPAGIVCGLLFSGFELNDIFFGMAALFSVSCIWTFATVLGMRNTGIPALKKARETMAKVASGEIDGTNFEESCIEKIKKLCYIFKCIIR